MMITVFLSYSRKDHFFAELVEAKLREKDIKVWRDQGQLRPGTDWRDSIERGIGETVAVLVALGPNSAESAYVTYEWAYAFGSGKVVIPLKLAECSMHPKLETIQSFDFSVPGALPWEALAERIREIETDSDQGTIVQPAEPPITVPDPIDKYVQPILGYLNQRGYQMASFDRLRRRIDASLTDDDLRKLVARNRNIFRLATLKEGKLGLAKTVP
jgi:TIR domain